MQEPTNRELKIMLDNVINTMERIEKTGTDTNAKATYTNGRVTHLEEVQKQNHEILVKHEDGLYGTDGLIRWKDKVWGMIKIVTISASFTGAVLVLLFTLYIRDLKNSIIKESSEKVLSSLGDYDNIIIKNN